MILNEDLDSAADLNKEEKTIKLKKMEFGKSIFAFDKKTNIVYNWIPLHLIKRKINFWVHFNPLRPE